MFWFFMYASAVVFTIGTLNPAWLVAVVIAYVVSRPTTDGLRAEVKKGGLDPDGLSAHNSADALATCMMVLVKGASLFTFVYLVWLFVQGEL